MKRGDIYLADLNPIYGSEQGGYGRPVVVLQNNMGNRYSPTVIVAPLSTADKKPIPTHVSLEQVGFLRHQTIALLEQIKSIDKSRLLKYLGQLDKVHMKQIDNALAVSVGLDEVCSF